QGMGDRFTYLPMIGLAMAAIWGAADVLGKRPRAAVAISAAVLAALGLATWSHTRVWRNSVTVFANTVAVTGNNSAAQHFLAAALRKALDIGLSPKNAAAALDLSKAAGLRLKEER